MHAMTSQGRYCVIASGALSTTALGSADLIAGSPDAAKAFS